MDLKGFGSKRSWPNFKVPSRHSRGGTDENHEKPQSGYSVTGAEIRSRDLPNTKQDCEKNVGIFTEQTDTAKMCDIPAVVVRSEGKLLFMSTKKALGELRKLVVVSGNYQQSRCYLVLPPPEARCTPTSILPWVSG
jgi:hypothetical protein